MALLGNWFDPDDAQEILKIPPCLLISKYALCWHYSKNGKYTVKSGYCVLCDRLEVGRSSNPWPLERWWEEPWRLKIPQKTRLFLWRMCHNWTRTLGNLASQRMRVYPKCPYCKAENETPFHTIWGYYSISLLWKATDWWKYVKTTFYGDLIGFLMGKKDELSRIDFDTIVVLTWSCWARRDE